MVVVSKEFSLSASDYVMFHGILVIAFNGEIFGGDC